MSQLSRHLYRIEAAWKVALKRRAGSSSRTPAPDFEIAAKLSNHTTKSPKLMKQDDQKVIVRSGGKQICISLRVNSEDGNGQPNLGRRMKLQAMTKLAVRLIGKRGKHLATLKKRVGWRDFLIAYGYLPFNCWTSQLLPRKISMALSRYTQMKPAQRWASARLTESYSGQYHFDMVR